MHAKIDKFAQCSALNKKYKEDEYGKGAFHNKDRSSEIQ